MTDMKIVDIVGLKRVKGDVGIEIEMETTSERQYPLDIVERSGLWRGTGDGSLRGNAVEWVLRKPLPIKDARVAVEELFSQLAANRTLPRYTFRAGVHVHVNVQEMTVEQLKTFSVVYFILESLLVDFCGDDRVGNLFCLRAVDAEFLISFVAQQLKMGRLAELQTDNIRYSAINFKPVPMYGSVEFRAMATKEDFSGISDWAEMLHHLKVKSMEYASGSEVLVDFSMRGDDGWVKHILGDHFYNMVCPNKNFKEHVWTGMRLAQDFNYFSMN